MSKSRDEALEMLQSAAVNEKHRESWVFPSTTRHHQAMSVLYKENIAERGDTVLGEPGQYKYRLKRSK